MLKAIGSVSRLAFKQAKRGTSGHGGAGPFKLSGTSSKRNFAASLRTLTKKFEPSPVGVITTCVQEVVTPMKYLPFPSHEPYRFNQHGPTFLADHGEPDEEAVDRLNQLDKDRKVFDPGEAYCAAKLEKQLRCTLTRTQGGSGADYVVVSGMVPGMLIDIKLAPRNKEAADKLNKHFDQTFSKFSQNLRKKLANAEEKNLIVACNTAFLNKENKQKFFEFVGTLPMESQKRLLIYDFEPRFP